MKTKKHTSMTIRRAHDRSRIVRAIMATSVVGAVFASSALAQVETSGALAERSSIIVAGKVIRSNASLEPLQAASPQTVVIKVLRMYAGADIAGDQTGHTATVILSPQSKGIETDVEAVFFGNPRFVGKSLTIADEGEIPADATSAATVGIESAGHDRPLRDRIIAASSIFQGKVESEHTLVTADGELKDLREPAGEHDPEWHVATVLVLSALRGSKEGELISVIFSASDDIVWFNSPKLKVGEEAMFIAHRPETDGVQLTADPGVAKFLQKQSAVVISQPFDTVPATEEVRVRTLMAKGK
jgi:hypothetical protein